MKTTILAPLLLVALAACDDGPRVVVRASLNGRAVADLPVTLLPYDRDALQDSLRRGDESDAAQLPQELLRKVAQLDSALDRAGRDSAGIARADSLRARRDSIAARADSAARAWESRLLHRADSLGRARAEETDRTPSADTTDASGRAALAASPGMAWLRARYVLPDAVIEWNVPVTLPAGQDSIVAALDQTNARRVEM
jgi:hypothetical protein